MDLKIFLFVAFFVVFTEKCEGCKIPILSSDHSSGKNYIGQYFNFDRKRIRGLHEGGSKKFRAYNLRSGLIGRVIVWGSKNGGSKGDAHGRFDNRKVAPKPGQWQPGDYLVPMDCSICAKVSNTTCEIKVLGIAHGTSSYSDGRYFNFNRAKVNGLGVNGGMQFVAYNPRTSVIGRVYVWGRASGGGIGDAHGQFHYKNVQPRANQWKTGDVVIPIDQSICVQQCPLDV
ncbi:uncharacterized protein [Clytia hemisphaerica]|eukprot:TCONS_00011544-protein